MTRPLASPGLRDRRARWLAIGGVAVLAFVVRGWMLVTSPRVAIFPGTDDTWYDAVARSIERGDFGRLASVTGGSVLSPRFPPAYPVVLATGRSLLFWVETQHAHRWTGVLLGTLAAATVAALAWRLGPNTRAGTRALMSLAAGLLFAANPVVAGASTALMSEALVLPVTALVLLLVDRQLTGDGRTWEVVALGGLLGVGALTRSEAIVLLSATVIGACVACRRVRRWILPLALGIAAVIAWSAVVSVAAGRTVVMSTNSGSLLLGANCVHLHDADGIGYWSWECLPLPDAHVSRETARRTQIQDQFLMHNFAFPPQIGARAEAEISREQLDAAIDNLRDRPIDTAEAIPVRVLRGLGLYWSPLQDDQESLEGRDHGWEVAGRWFNIVLILPLASLTVLGALWRRSRPGRRLRELVDARRLIPSLALIAAWLVTIMLSYGSARFRAPIEPSLAIFAALGMTMLATAMLRRSRRESTSSPRCRTSASVATCRACGARHDLDRQ